MIRAWSRVLGAERQRCSSFSMVYLSQGVDETGDRGIDPVLIGEDREDGGFGQALVGEGQDYRLEGLAHGGSPVGCFSDAHRNGHG